MGSQQGPPPTFAGSLMPSSTFLPLCFAAGSRVTRQQQQWRPRAPHLGAPPRPGESGGPRRALPPPGDTLFLRAAPQLRGPGLPLPSAQVSRGAMGDGGGYRTRSLVLPSIPGWGVTPPHGDNGMVTVSLLPPLPKKPAAAGSPRGASQRRHRGLPAQLPTLPHRRGAPHVLAAPPWPRPRHRRRLLPPWLPDPSPLPAPGLQVGIIAWGGSVGLENQLWGLGRWELGPGRVVELHWGHFGALQTPLLVESSPHPA